MRSADDPVALLPDLLPRRRRTVLPDRAIRRAETQRFLDALILETPTPTYPVLFLTMARTGLRPGEALALRVDDLDLIRGSLRIDEQWTEGHLRPGTKGGEIRFVRMSAQLRGVLERWVRGLGPRDWLFPGKRPDRPLSRARVSVVMKQVLQAAGLPRHLSPHAFRHGWATTVLEDRIADLFYVQRALGHRRIQTTIDCYARFADPQDPAVSDRLDDPRTADLSEIGRRHSPLQLVPLGRQEVRGRAVGARPRRR